MSYDSRELVVPGTPLYVLEEYMSGEGTFVDSEAGVVRAAVTGRAVVNHNSKSVSVKMKRKPPLPEAGDSVLALVTNVRHDLVVVEIYGEVAVQPKIKWLREYTSTFTGGIPLSQIADEFIKDINDYYRIGDVIIGRVLNTGTPYTLTTKPPVYGVLYAQCSNCGALLEPVNPRTMKCPRCGNVEKRKVSILASSKLLPINIKRLLLQTRT